MIGLGRGLGLAIVVLLAATGLARAAPPPPTVILISLDGTRPEWMRHPKLPALTALAQAGASAERMIPAFPTNTFPNHVTLVTGVAPERHGIVNNVFVDPERGRYSRDSDPTWIEVEPLWSLASRQGVVCAAYHWVGSEGAWRTGFGPRHWKPFDGSVSVEKKVDQILAWLDLPDPRVRPRFITAWFPGADGVAHHHGPDAPRVLSSLRRQDRALARLQRELRARHAWRHTTLILVSDHGMLAVERSVDLQAAFERTDLGARILGTGGFATVVGAPTDGERKRVVEVARGLGLEAYVRGRAPPALRVANPRFGDVIVLAPPGLALARGRGRGRPGAMTRLWEGLVRRKPRASLLGAHGYRPEVAAMGALFLAMGRGAKPGKRLGRVRAVDVAPTVLALLGLPVPDWMEGRPIAGVAAPPAVVRAPEPLGPALQAAAVGRRGHKLRFGEDER